MSIAFVQSVTGAGATLAINGVVQGHLLVIQDTFFKAGSSSYTETKPSDANGTVQDAVRVGSALFNLDSVGTSICFVENASAGTHTVTPDATTGSRHLTITEFSGILHSGSLDQSNHGESNTADITSRSTNSTANTTQNDELLIAGLALAAFTGSANVGYTDPPTGGWTKLQSFVNDSSDVAGFHAYQIVAATGPQSCTFNWTAHEAAMGAQAVIATFKAGDDSTADTKLVKQGTRPRAFGPGIAR